MQRVMNPPGAIVIPKVVEAIFSSHEWKIVKKVE
jgi:hypothetical protein